MLLKAQETLLDFGCDQLGPKPGLSKYVRHNTTTQQHRAAAANRGSEAELRDGRYRGYVGRSSGRFPATNISFRGRQSQEKD